MLKPQETQPEARRDLEQIQMDPEDTLCTMSQSRGDDTSGTRTHVGPGVARAHHVVNVNILTARNVPYKFSLILGQNHARFGTCDACAGHHD